MKFSVRLAALSTLAFAASVFAFGGGQTPIYPTQTDAQAAEGAARAVQQGKGSGTTRNTASANAYRSAAPQDSQTVRIDSPGQQNDSAFRK